MALLAFFGRQSKHNNFYGCDSSKSGNIDMVKRPSEDGEDSEAKFTKNFMLNSILNCRIEFLQEMSAWLSQATFAKGECFYKSFKIRRR